MKRRRLLAALVLVGVFLLGAVAGASTATVVVARRIARLFESPKETMARLYGWQLGRRLHLTDAQRAEVERIVLDDHAELAKLWQTIEPQAAELRRRRHARIRAILTPEQQREADVLEGEFERRHREEIDLAP